MGHSQPAVSEHNSCIDYGIDAQAAYDVYGSDFGIDPCMTRRENRTGLSLDDREVIWVIQAMPVWAIKFFNVIRMQSSRAAKLSAFISINEFLEPVYETTYSTDGVRVTTLLSTPMKGGKSAVYKASNLCKKLGIISVRRADPNRPKDSPHYASYNCYTIEESGLHRLATFLKEGGDIDTYVSVVEDD